MDFGFTEEHGMLRDMAAKFFVKECPFDMVRELEEKDTGFSREMWTKMAELGWMGVMFPEEYGGYGGQFVDIAIIMEEMGKRAVPSPFYTTVIQCGLIILEGGSEEQKHTLFGKISEGELILALARFEEEGTYLSSGIRMTAQDNGDHYLLNGTKLFVMDANICDKMLVLARDEDKGITICLADAGDPGITCTKMPTIGMDNNCEVIFENVKVLKDNIIGEPGQGWEIFERTADRATVAKCAEAVGGCKTCIDMTSAYAKERVQYGKPIGGFQAIQHYMANMLLGYDTTSNYLYKVCWMAEEGMDITREVHSLKAQANEQYKFITERAVQIHGGVGTTREFDVALFYRRAKACEYILGDSDYHWEKLAVALGM